MKTVARFAADAQDIARTLEGDVLTLRRELAEAHTALDADPSASIVSECLYIITPHNLLRYDPINTSASKLSTAP